MMFNMFNMFNMFSILPSRGVESDEDHARRMTTRRNIRALTALVTASVVFGCGNLSNEDLKFLAGMPRAKEVELHVEGTATNPNALTSGDAVGDPAGLYQH
ncbi:MAG: hypothetical protein V3T05_11220, partial [Myxococcota bacterium]